MDNLTITNEDISQLELEFDGELSFKDRRKTVLRDYNDVQACAGSGKTTLVAAKLILLAKKWTEEHRGVCVLTHMNTAKDEIKERLQSHPAGYKMLSYPHFVGTIQEFVNRYLGLPYLRTMCEFKRFSEENEATMEVYRAARNGFRINELCGNLYRSVGKLNYQKIKRCLGSLHYLNSSFDLGFFYGQHGGLLSCKAANNSDRYILLQKLKERMNLSGIFQFQDMYAFASRLLDENLDVGEALRRRFPFVLIDEMQDTQRFQDVLIYRVFDCANVSMQRFGDPDQAIFDGIGGAEPNDSYNSVDLVAIPESHRFGNDIAYKIRGLSYNQLELQSIREVPEGDAPHTIFLYDEQSIKLVLPAFGQLVLDYLSSSESFTEEHREEFVIKAVGGIGKENPDSLTIKHYWEDFDKSKASKSFRAGKLIHIIAKCAANQEADVSDDYDLLMKGVLDFLRKADRRTIDAEGRNVYFGKTTLIQYLQAEQKYQEFRRLLTSWIIEDFPQQEVWEQRMMCLKRLLGLSDQPIAQEALEFISYDGNLPHEQEEQGRAANIYQYNDSLRIEVATIHSVKGETHDATLTLETKYNRYFDIEESLDFLIDDEKVRPPANHEKPRKKTSIQANFLKRLYVAASRPRYLLCLALHSDHISDEQVAALRDKGWQFRSYVPNKGFINLGA